MSFSTQPNEMLDMILNQTGIPLSQRIRLRAVSPRFNATLLDGLQQERSLVIRVVNRGDLKQLNSGQAKVQPNDLLLKESHFSKKHALDFLHRLFPQATELAIASDSLIAWRKFVGLLRLYAPTLRSLKVDGYLANPSLRESVFRSLPQVINSIANLSSLYLENGKASSDHIFQPSIGHYLLLHLAPTLSRLERFTLEKPILYNHVTFMVASLSPRCTHLHLNFVTNDVITFPLLPNLTHLHLTFINDAFLQFVNRLPRLTTLILQDEKKPDLGTLLPKVRLRSMVTQVTFLGINYSRPLEPPATDAFTFPSIKRLTLQLDYLTPNIPFNALDYLSTLASWFPSLSNCALHTPEEYREGVLAIQDGLPFTVKLLDNCAPTFE